MTISRDDKARASRSRVSPNSEVEKGTPALGSPPTPALMQASIVTPGDWTELDLDPATRHTSIRRAVRRAIVRSRALAPDAVPLIALLDHMTRRADDAGAFYCASRVIEDTADGVLVATAVMQICQSEEAPDPGNLSLSAAQRCAALATAIDDAREWVGGDVGVVTLQFIGPAVRLRMEDGAIIMQYIVPLVGLRRYLVATFTCSCPPFALIMTELFDTMAQSLALHYA